MKGLKIQSVISVTFQFCDQNFLFGSGLSRLGAGDSLNPFNTVGYLYPGCYSCVQKIVLLALNHSA
jgi:hypothetical protein